MFCIAEQNSSEVKGVRGSGMLGMGVLEDLSVRLCWKASRRGSFGGSLPARRRSASAPWARISLNTARWSFSMPKPKPMLDVSKKHLFRAPFFFCASPEGRTGVSSYTGEGRHLGGIIGIPWPGSEAGLGVHVALLFCASPEGRTGVSPSFFAPPPGGGLVLVTIQGRVPFRRHRTSRRARLGSRARGSYTGSFGC